jgi:hypothetical protein
MGLAGLGMSAAGSFFNARSANRDRESNEALTREQIALQRAQVEDQLRGSQANRALVGALLPQIDNFNVSAPDVPTQGLGSIMGTSIGSYAPQMSGGVLNAIPAGGIPQDVLDLFQPGAPVGGGGAAGTADYGTVSSTPAGGGGPGRGMGAAQGAASGASFGSMFGPIGMGVGAGVGALIGTIQGGRNDTKGQREEFASQMGHSLNTLLDTLATQHGEEGRRLQHEALNIIGRKDNQRNAVWMNQVYALLNGGG